MNATQEAFVPKAPTQSRDKERRMKDFRHLKIWLEEQEEKKDHTSSRVKQD